MNKLRPSDYRLTGKDTALAIQNGLAEATWYASPVGKQEMRELPGGGTDPPFAHALIWFVLSSARRGGFLLWGGWWAVLPFMVYGVLYGSAVRPALARMRTRHGVQDALDEQRRLPDRLVYGLENPTAGVGATRAITATRSSSAATRRSP